VSRSPPEPALARHLERITGYLQEAGLRQIPQHPHRPGSIQIAFQRIEKGLLCPSR